MINVEVMLAVMCGLVGAFAIIAIPIAIKDYIQDKRMKVKYLEDRIGYVERRLNKVEDVVEKKRPY